MKQLTLIGIFALVLISCSVLKNSASSDSQSGVELWALHCARCHNIPAPDDYNANQWDVIGTHMRVRANINADEIEKITTFLNSQGEKE